MSMSRVLVLGGIRSGKSEFAEELLADAESVAYLATAAAPDDDDPQWAERIAAHRTRRPGQWVTEEFGADPYGLALRLSGAKPAEALLLDDLGGWLTAVLNLADAWADPRAADDAIDALASGLADCAAARVVLVSPEVGLSVVPATEAGRTFADALGRLNRQVAAHTDGLVLVVAGQPTWLKGTAQQPPTASPALTSAGSAATAAEGPAARVSGASAGIIGVSAQASTVDGSGAPEINTGLDLPMPDESTAAGAALHLLNLDFAGSGLGTLTEVVKFAAGTQSLSTPAPWRRIRVLLLHGEHAGGGAAGDQPDAVARRLEQSREGVGAVALLADAAGAAVDTVACPPSGPMEMRDVLTPEAVDAALALGWRLAEAAVDGGTDALVLAATGVGSEAAAVAVTTLAAGGEAAALLDRVVDAAGLVDDNAWMVRCGAVRDALHRVRARPRDPRSLLATVGGGDIAVATGLILGAVSRRTPVLIDGPVGVAAALVARDFGAQTRHWLLLPDHGGHPLVRFGADVLGLTPVLHLRLALGEGAAALAALPLLGAALALAAGTPAAPPPGLTEDSPRWEVTDFPTSELPIVKP
jgi:adenosyl cobinamide kinase/adenosyl cobinamide phosphate guanylyltransferase/NaMN:DMB phosphoribosyltransferase